MAYTDLKPFLVIIETQENVVARDISNSCKNRL